MPFGIPTPFLDQLESGTKDVTVAVTIEDAPDVLTSRVIYKRVRYGDPDIFYGDPGLIYGGLIPVSNQVDLLTLEGSKIAIQQIIDPQRGKGSVATIQLSFVDLDEYMTRLISPGIVLNDILGKSVEVRIGFEQIAWPEDYLLIFRGFITQVTSASGRVVFQLSDPNLKRRQEIFFCAKTTLSAPIDDATTTIPVTSNQDFFGQILGPSGVYDAGVKTYIKVDDEFMEYGPSGMGGNDFTVTRGVRGTLAEAHDVDAEVSAAVQIEDHAINLALKIMLSGWNGYFETEVPVLSLRKTLVPEIGDVNGALLLPVGVDAIRDYGLIEGDFVTISGAINGANNVTLSPIVRFIDIGDQANRIIVISDNLVNEYPTTALLSFRSQYDTLPTECGLRMSPDDVDVERHEYYRDTFLPNDIYRLRFLMNETVNGKDFLESECYLPVYCYSITRRGRVSMGLTKPPIADQQLVFLSADNITDPETIAPVRATNNRYFYNQIDFDWDYDDEGVSRSALRVLDSDSLNIIGTSQTLPIASRGSRTDLGADIRFQNRSQLLLSRFARGALQIEIKTNYEVGARVEVGDVVALEDNGGLQITNIQTGERDLGVQLFEVIERNLDIGQGKSRLVLISGVGAEATDRFATISPSSMLESGSTTTEIKIKASYGEVFPGDEPRKWEDYIGEKVIIHDELWTFQEERTFTHFKPSDRFTMIIDPPLSIPPPENYIIDIPAYPTSVDPAENRLYKLIHAFFSPQVSVTSGTSMTEFDVSPGDIAKFFEGSIILVHDETYSQSSPEAIVTNVTGTTVTVDRSLGFIPSPADLVDLIGFADGGAAYRYI